MTNQILSQTPRKLPAVVQDGETWMVPSFRGEASAYHVSLHGAGACTCPDYLYRHAEKGTECKHIRETRRQAAFLTALETARGLSDADLEKFLAKHVDNPTVAGAIRMVRFERKQPVTPAAVPALPSQEALKAIFA